MKTAGKLVKVVRGEEHYTIERYEDLSPLLGEQWFIRGINTHLDFCAVVADTVTFYLHKKADIVDYLSPNNVDGGYVLVFKFVRFNGVKEELSRFGVNV